MDWDNFWQVLAILGAAVVAAIGTIYGARWSGRNERARNRQELITIMGTDRQRLSEELTQVRNGRREVDEELEKVRDERRALADEYANAKISHREAIAVKDADHRAALMEKDISHQQTQAQLRSVEQQLAESRRALERCQTELERRGDLIRAQSEVIAELRARRPLEGA